jgi:hypothetical protein
LFAHGFAYRGVGSDPDVYRGRGGFLPHQITSLQIALAALKNLAFKDDGLTQHASRWQMSKDKADGYFLSTGLDQAAAYDNYPFLYRIDISGLRLRSWNGAGFVFKIDSIDNCFLYTDNANVDASTMIAIVCLDQGPGRSYELLIMSPVLPAACSVEWPKGSHTYISFDEWTRQNPK